MSLKLFLPVLFFCTICKGQSSADLKEFINKNNTAIRSVQKNMLRENSNTFAISFKQILKNQEAAVKIYSTDKSTSSHFALLVRNECLAFLKGHAKGSTEYFEIADSEKSFLKTGTETSTKVLSTTELQEIENMEVMNTQNLNQLTLTIQ
ncbi:MAG: hypothetical protein H7141_08415 [Burkholderiales bacterium]|nr:hypothetical protein [Bacteroidia bacterium]